MQFAKRTALLKDSSTLAITARAKEMKDKGQDVVMFAGGEPDFNTPDYINNAAIAAIKSGFTKYTAASGIPELRRAIADKFAKDNGLDYKPSQIIISNGGKHSLANIFWAILNDGDEVLIPSPFWLSYPQMVLLAGGVPVIVETKAGIGFKATRAELETAVTDRTKAIIINSPSNPTGMVYTRAELESVAAFAKEHDLVIISDEVYEKLIYDEGFEHISIAGLSGDAKERTVVVNALSKTYSMTGWRVGYLACEPKLAEVIANIQSHTTSNPNSIAQKAAYTALTEETDFIEEMRAEFKRRRDYMYARLQNIPGVSCVKPNGAFYMFINVEGLCNEKIPNAAALAEILLNGYLVAAIPCADFGFDKYIRFSYTASMDAIEKGMDRFEKLAKEIKGV